MARFRSTPSARSALVLLAGLCGVAAAATTSRVASAGPVTFRSGLVDLVAGGDDLDRVEERVVLGPADFPGSDSRSVSSVTGPNSTAEASYNVTDAAADRTVLEATVRGEAFATAIFQATFSTDRPTQFSLFADPRQFIFFEATFNDVVADVRFNGRFVDPVLSGSLVDDTGEGVEARTFQGTLAPGTHTFRVTGTGGFDRSTALGGGGLARLTITDAMANPIPLPPAVWAGLVTLAAAGTARRLRQRLGRA